MYVTARCHWSSLYVPDSSSMWRTLWSCCWQVTVVIADSNSAHLLTCSPHGLRYLLLKPIWRATETVKFPLTSLKVRSSFIPGCDLIRFNDALSPDSVRSLNIVVENVTELRTYVITRVCLLRACSLMASECGTAYSVCDPEKSPIYWTLDDSWLRIKGNPIHALHSTDQMEVSNLFGKGPEPLLSAGAQEARVKIINWYT